MEPTVKLKIFLVDDSPTYLEMYKNYLVNLGYPAVFSFASSRTFLKRLNLKPDMVFLAYPMDSLETIEILKKISEFNPHILVVFIADQKEKSSIEKTRRQGAFDYMMKNEVTEIRLRLTTDKAKKLKKMRERRQKQSRAVRVLSDIGITSLLFLLHKIFLKG